MFKKTEKTSKKLVNKIFKSRHVVFNLTHLYMLVKLYCHSVFYLNFEFYIGKILYFTRMYKRNGNGKEVMIMGWGLCELFSGHTSKSLCSISAQEKKLYTVLDLVRLRRSTIKQAISCLRSISHKVARDIINSLSVTTYICSTQIPNWLSLNCIYIPFTYPRWN